MLALTAVFAYGWHVNNRKIVSLAGTGQETPGALAERRKRTAYCIIFAVLAFLPMFLVNALMSYVGNDYQNYFTYYQRIVSGGEQDVEFTYKLICLFADKIGLGFQGVYYIYCLISYTLLSLCIRKYSANYAVSYLMFFFNGYFALLGLQQIRQFTAVVLIFYAYDYIAKRKLLPYLICVLIAGAFHVTALVMLPFYWILHVKWRASVYVVIMCVLFPLRFFHVEIMQWLFQTFMPRYLNTNYATREFGVGINYLFMVVVTLFIVLLCERKCKKELTVFKNGVILANIIVLFANWLPEYQRFVFYFLFPSIAYVPQLVEAEESLKKRLLLYGVLFVIYIWYFMAVFPGSTINPYKSILG